MRATSHCSVVAFALGSALACGCDAGLPCPTNDLELRPGDGSEIAETNWTCSGRIAEDEFFCNPVHPKATHEDAACSSIRIRAHRAAVDGGGALALYVEVAADGSQVLSVAGQLEYVSSEPDEPSHLWTTIEGWIAFEAFGTSPTDRFAAHFGLLLGDDLGSMTGAFDTTYPVRSF